MAVVISDDCISCGACASECPNTAIYEGGAKWSMADGTKHADSARKDALDGDHYFSVPFKCTQCVGFNDKPACIEVCPVEAITIGKPEDKAILEHRFKELYE
ncbi:MAG TPA: ferredoxin [Bacteroidales bacterium]|nr:ferredoxin [Bacteroidales bacterium]